MNDKTLFKALIFGALLAGVASVITLTHRGDDEPRKIVPVKAVGKRVLMPAVEMSSTSGQKWTLAEHKGRIVLVNFWATWCGPCRKETPDLVRVYEKYRGRGVTIAGISMDQKPREVVPKFAERYGIEYPLLVPGDDTALSDSIETIPTSFLVDQQGRIAKTFRGVIHEAELASNIEELLAEGNGS